MKSIKIRDVPVILVLLFSALASLLMGCGGGGGGGSGSPGGGTTGGKAPSALATGNQLVLTGGYVRVNPSLGANFIGTTLKSITFTSPTTANYNVTYVGETNSGNSTALGNVTYNRVSADLAKVTLTNFPYFSDGDSVRFGVIEVQLTFAATGNGSYSETAITVVTPYSGTGNFTFSSSGGGSSGGGGSIL